jgi:PAS domain S-box-containing protein
VSTAEQMTREQLLLELDELTRRLQEAEDTLEAIRTGGIDALVVADGSGPAQLFTLEGADHVYRVFLESISQGALTLSEDGLILFANEAAGRLLSAKTELVVGAQLRSFVRVADRRRFEALLERGRAEPVNAEIRMSGRRGGRPVYLSLHPLHDRHDHMVVAVVTDLSEQKRSEATLESERLARSIFQQAGEPIIVCDSDGMVLRASRSAVRLAGRPLLFQAFDDVLPLRTADGCHDYSLGRTAGLKRVQGEEVRFDRGDGDSFRLILTANPLKTAEQGYIGQVVTLADVTRLKLAEEAREQLLRDVERANAELETIESLSRAGLQLSNVNQLAHSIVSRVAAAMRADEAVLLLIDGDDVELVASVPPDEGGRRRVAIGAGFVGAVARMRRTLFIEDALSSRLVTERERARGKRSLLGTPLLEGDDLLGVLCVGWKDLHVADAGQQRFLEIIADRAATAISARVLTEQLDEQVYVAESLAAELAQANADLQYRHHVLEFLQELTTVANSSLSLPEIGRAVLELIRDRLDLAAGFIYAMAQSGGELRALATIGFPDEHASRMRVVPVDDQSTLGRLVRGGLPIVTHESGPPPPMSRERLRSVVGAASARWVAIPLRRGGRVLGVFGLILLGERPFEEDELTLYRSIAELLGAALENARAYEAETVAQMKQATQEERSRLARDLHDSITQALFAAALKAEALTEDDAIPAHGAETAAEVRRLTRGALAEMRTLLIELRSDSPEDMPIEHLLRNVVEATEGRASIAVSLKLRGDAEPPRKLHAALYRIAQEALNNVVRHSKATRAVVELVVEPSRVQLLVHDDGCGFQPGPMSQAHFGLRSMRERAEEVGAELRLVSAPGEGTLVRMDWRAGADDPAPPV